MNTARPLLDHPVVLLLFSFGLLWLAMRAGAALQARHGPLDEDRRGDFDMVLGATLTLLSLIVAFSFSMASSRYDKRILCEAEEANAIGTAYVRAGAAAGGRRQKGARSAARIHGPQSSLVHDGGRLGIARS